MSSDIARRLMLKVYSPEELMVEREVDSVSLPGLDGELGILPGHRSMILMLGEGRLTFRAGTQESGIPVKGGTAEINPGQILVFIGLPGEEEKGSDGA